MSVLKSSILRKVTMALSGLFLVVFLLQHFTINFSSVISPSTFNQWSHFMGYNGLVQFVLQPILVFGIVFHFVMGFILEIQNKKSRGVPYAQFKGSKNASWVSRNMIISGGVVLLFLVLHFIDFWIPEMEHKYLEGSMFNAELIDEQRYYEELVHKFEPYWRVIVYVLSFVFLSMHLYHGFSSSFQTLGLKNSVKKSLLSVTRAFAIVIPLGFIVIALYHHLFSAHHLLYP
ncbi:MAG: succinate dehydrogenase cytochrome b subunit [Flavobacteriaceae bacterium]|nr:succinate dehydrogenase cytochrome b subunit [Flavobacteriaceae bacterium]